MAVKILSRKYTDLFRPTESTDWLLGNTGDLQKLTLTCEVAAEFKASFAETLQIDSFENTITLNNGKSWSGFGFDIGDSATLDFVFMADPENDGSFVQIPQTITFNITGLFDDVMETDADFGFPEYELFPVDRGNVKIVNVVVYSEKEFQGARCTYGHISNEDFETENLNSFIDGTQSEMGFAELNTIPVNTWSNMELYGLQSGMSIRQSRIRQIDNPGNSSNINGLFTVSNIGFRLQPFYSDFPFGSSLDQRSEYFARPIQMTFDPGTTTNHQAIGTISQIPRQTLISGTEQYSNSASQYMFINNAATDFAQQYLFDLSFVVSGAFDTSSSDKVSLVLLKYKNGSSYNFDSKIVLQEWENANSLINQTLIYQQSRTLIVAPGESYTLAIEYFHPMPASGISQNRWVDITGLQGTIGLPFVSNQSDFYKRYYEIEIEYFISSFFDTVENVENRVLPTFLAGDGSLTDNFDVRFFPEWNNPNLIVQNDLQETKRLGNTGWFDENFNQLDNDFQVVSVVYRDPDNNIVLGMDYTQSTQVEITVSGVPNLNTNSRFGFGFMYLPQDEDAFKEVETPHYMNTFLATGSYLSSYPLAAAPDPIEHLGAGINGGAMKVRDIYFQEDSGNVVFRAIFTPDGTFTSQIEAKQEDDRKYLIYLSVADSSSSARNFSNRVSLLCDVNDLVKNITPAGPYDMATRFIEHPFESDVVGVEEYDGLVQDDVLVRSRFNIDADANTVFQSVTFAIEMENEDTGQIFNLEEYPVDVSLFPTDSNGFQIFDVDQVRGFRLNDGNNKNWVKIETDESNSSDTSKAYIAYYAFKIRYEDWIAKTGVPSDFFDDTEDNNGNHNDWYHYITAPGSSWSIKYSVYILANVDGEVKFFRTPHNFTFKDYDQNSLVATAVRYFRDSDNTLINVGTDPETGNPLGVILSGESTRIEHDFTIQDAGTWSTGQVYATTTIEVDKGDGIFGMHQISSVWEVGSDNALTFVSGESNLKIVIDGTQKILTTSCLVDPEVLEDAIRYRVTGRVGCFEVPIQTEDGGIYETAYESAYE